MAAGYGASPGDGLFLEGQGYRAEYFLTLERRFIVCHSRAAANHHSAASFYDCPTATDNYNSAADHHLGSAGNDNRCYSKRYHTSTDNDRARRPGLIWAAGWG
jgi:hypothetical protein